MRLLLILACLPLLALDNGKTFNNATTGTLTSRVLTAHWYLAPGDILSFPRPYVTPSSTSVRVAAASWQADVKSRWRDGVSARAITGVLSGPPTWNTTGGSLVSIKEESTDIATITTAQPHSLNVGDRLTISGAAAPADVDLNRDHYVVLTVPTTTTATVATQNVTTGTYSQTGLTVRQLLDPSAPGRCRIKSPNHRLEVADEVTVSDVAGIAGIAGTWRVVAAAQSDFLINTTCSGTYAGGGTVTGPEFGSVKTALVSFVSDVPASGSVRADLVNSTDACHLGDDSTCRAAGLDKAGMLAFNGGTWDATLSLTAAAKTGSTGTISRSARTMLGNWNETERYCRPRYWQRGPVVTQLILEYACDGEMTSDLGWKVVPGSTLAEAIVTTGQTQFNVADASNLELGARLWFMGASTVVEHMTVTAISGQTLTVARGADSSTPTTWANGKGFGVLQWQDATDDGFKSLHPSFVLTFPAGWAGVKVETRLENTYWNKQQGIYYSTGLVVGGVTRLTKPEMKHAARTRWRKTFWSGSNPDVWCDGGAGTDGDNCSGSGGGSRALVLRVDHNTDYLSYAKALPAWHRNPSATPYSWWYSLSGGGFNISDFGDFAVQRWVTNSQTGDNTKPKFPLTYLGGGTWGSDVFAARYASKDFQNGTQEGWPMPRALSNWVQSWDKYGYDLLLGVSTPGGGGNSVVEGYIPWLTREDLPRGPYVAGWPDEAVARFVSTHTRPSMATRHDNYYISLVMANDSPKVSCAAAGSATYTSALAATNGNWPCWHTGSQGSDSWLWEIAHMNDWSWTAWLVTGDDWHWQTLLGKASFASGFGHTTTYGKNPGKLWAYSYASDHIRQEAWGTQAILHALNASPTELMFGQSSTPERNLMLAQLWDGVLFAEGASQETSGWASILYGDLFSTDCTGYSGALGSASSSDRYKWGRCNLGAPANALGYFPSALRYGSCTPTAAVDCATATYEHPIWMLSYPNIVWNRMGDLGFPGYDYVRLKMGKLLINATLNKDFGLPYGFGNYNAPIVLASTATLPQTWAQWRTGFSPSGLGQTSWTSIGGSAPLPIGYSYRLMSILSHYTDLVDTTTEGCQPAKRPPVGCTGLQAYNWYKSTLVNQADALNVDSKYYLLPRARITSISTLLSGGIATLRWIAPDGGACKVAINPTSSYDTTDAAATAVGRMQSYAVVATAGDTYRITCGQARAQGTL